MGRKPKAKASEDQPPLVAQPLGGDASPPISTLPTSDLGTYVDFPQTTQTFTADSMEPISTTLTVPLPYVQLPKYMQEEQIKVKIQEDM